MLTERQIADTAASITDVQVASGMIPWFPGGHADPWNHVEAAMALSVAGRRVEAERAYEWLRSSQHDDGSWCSYYIGGHVEDARRDTNVSAYVATGVWHHYLATGDLGFLETMWASVDAAVGFALSLQLPSGALVWSIDPDGARQRYALLTGSSSVLFSVRCALAAAARLGHERPEWELGAGRLAHAVAHRPEAFADKSLWAMDWYYPVLCGALRGEAGRVRIAERWNEFVRPGKGVHCISGKPWVTAAETAECVIALDTVGLDEDARRLLSWAQHLRDDSGAYWTGCVYPQVVHFPADERSTYTSAAVLLADHALDGAGPTARLFRGDELPTGLQLDLDLDDVTQPGTI